MLCGLSCVYPRPLAVCFSENRVRPYLGSYGLDTTNNIEISPPRCYAAYFNMGNKITGHKYRRDVYVAHDAMTPSVYFCLLVLWGDSARGEIHLMLITYVRSGVWGTELPLSGWKRYYECIISPLTATASAAAAAAAAVGITKAGDLTGKVTQNTD